MRDITSKPMTVAVIGAGPVGLAAAAQAMERGLEPIVLEAGPEIGHAVRQWHHVQMFSPWQYNIDKAAERLLSTVGWNAPPAEDYPSGGELVAQYLDPLATRTSLKDRIKTSSRVTAITRSGADKLAGDDRSSRPFRLRYQNGRGVETLLADAVIDASGTWGSPNPAGADGLAAIGEDGVQDRLSYGMPDVLGNQRARYAGKRVAVLGAGHSAIGTLLDLARLQEAEPSTDIVWILRGANPDKSFGGGPNDRLVARGALGTAFAALIAAGRIEIQTGLKVQHLSHDGSRLRIATGAASCCRSVSADELVVATGFRPQLDFLRELRIALDPAVECPPILAPLIDPRLHSCGTVRPHGARELAQPEPGFYFAGMKSYGRAPTFLMMTGYEQVRSIVAEIAGDHAAAAAVELELPETGVCSGPAVASAGFETSASGCCGGPPAPPAAGCCVADVRAQEAGRAGCGCP